MIASRFPILRTNPGGFHKAGFWPVAVGSATVLLFTPFLAFITQAIALLFYGESVNIPRPLGSILVFLIMSPILSWGVLLFAVPVSVILARAGFAGWGVALSAGALGGLAGLIAIDGTFSRTDNTIAFAATGAILAFMYWLSIRLFSPTIVGITVKSDAR